jgi:hypothetical protein
MPTPLTIFISHKHDDAVAAMAVKDNIGRYSGDQIDIFLSSTDIPAGTEWLPFIREKLAQSNLLLLLFTDSTKAWDWCLYEAGMFTRLEGDYYKKVICIHDPQSKPPKPLQHLQAVPATVDGLSKFFHDLFCETTLTQLDRPLNSYLCKRQEVLRESAEELAKALTSKSSPLPPIFFGEYLSLRVADPTTILESLIPGDATVEASQRCLELFDKEAPPPKLKSWSWKDLEQEAKKNKDQRWIRELAKAIYRASRGNLVESIQATFCARRGGKTYRPILSGAEWGTDGSITFRVLFEEDVSWRLDDIPEQIAVLLTAQTMSIRFRYEVLKKFLPRLDDIESESAAQAACDEIRQTMQSIEEEAHSRGLLDKDTLMAAFRDDRQTIGRMFEAWYEIKKDLFDACDKGNVTELKRCFQQLIAINSQFIPLAAKTYEAHMTMTLDEELFSLPAN